MSEEEVPQQEEALQQTVEGYIASKVNNMQQDTRAEWIPPEIIPTIVEGATYYANLRLDIDLDTMRNMSSNLGHTRRAKIGNSITRGLTSADYPVPKLYSPDKEVVDGYIEQMKAKKAELHQSGTLGDKEEMARLAVWGFIATKQIEAQQEGPDKQVA